MVAVVYTQSKLRVYTEKSDTFLQEYRNMSLSLYRWLRDKGQRWGATPNGLSQPKGKTAEMPPLKTQPSKGAFLNSSGKCSNSVLTSNKNTMSKNNHYVNAQSCRRYEVEALHKHSVTGEFRSICHYRFMCCVTKVKSLKDVVRRDLKQMGFRPDRITIKNLDAGNSFTINCRKS